MKQASLTFLTRHSMTNMDIYPIEANGLIIVFL